VPALKNYIIGRSAQSDICLNDSSVSRFHAEITISTDGRFYLTDCNSSHGTFIARNGSWLQITQDFVTGNESVLLGRYQSTVPALLSLLKDDSQHSANDKLSKDSDATDAKFVENGLPVGRVARNPDTGEIIGLEDD
jgi:predicted component of type VI protein secretion system